MLWFLCSQVTKIFQKKKNSVTYSFRQSFSLYGMQVLLFENQCKCLITAQRTKSLLWSDRTGLCWSCLCRLPQRGPSDLSHSWSRHKSPYQLQCPQSSGPQKVHGWFARIYRWSPRDGEVQDRMWANCFIINDTNVPDLCQLCVFVSHSWARKTEGGGEAQHVPKFRAEEGNGQRQPESSQPGRQLRYWWRFKEKRPQQLPPWPFRRR